MSAVSKSQNKSQSQNIDGFVDIIEGNISYKSRLGLDRRRRMSWIVSFMDLMAIMLSFFVLIFSMSSPVEKSWTSFSGALKTQFEAMNADLSGYAGPSTAQNIVHKNSYKPEPLSYIQTVLDGMLSRLPARYADQIRVVNAADRLVISSPYLLGFDNEGIVISNEAQLFLSRLSGTLKGFDNKIIIVGHANENEGNGRSARYILSLERANTVKNYLKDKGLKQNFVIMGMGDARQTFLSEDWARAQKSTVQRRVDIAILKEE